MNKKFKFQVVIVLVSIFFMSGTVAWALGEKQVASGLKEALNVGIKTAVELLGKEDGYYENLDVKILLPEELKKADETIRGFGGAEISEMLVKKMNRAAEKAAPQALDIFVDGVKEMKIEDAMKLLSGEKNAATSYLQEHTSDDLIKAFYPVVQGTMEEVNALKTYNEYVGKLKSGSVGKVGSLLQSSGLTKGTALEGVTDIELDINKYVTEKAIGGLFSTLAKEEEKIRENPEARVTDLLKDVFGSILK